jgi:hypothetical protein
MSERAEIVTCGRDCPLCRSISTGLVNLGGERLGGKRLGAEGAAPEGWLWAAASGSLGRLSVRRNPGLRVQHMHNPPVAEILQPFSPKEVG